MRPGSRQATTVCVHILVDMEKQSDNELRFPSGMESLVCGAGLHPFVSMVCKRRAGVNLNRYAGFGSHTPHGTAITSLVRRNKFS